MSEATPSRGVWPLFAQHRAYLAGRGVNSKLAEKAGIRSLIQEEVAHVLGLATPPPCCGLLVPHCDSNGHVLTPRVRLDAPGGGPKFQIPAGSHVYPWLPPVAVLTTAGFSSSALQDPTLPLTVVEGAVQALALVGAGILAIGLSGVSAGGHDKDAKDRKHVIRAHSLLREWVALKGRLITILFDAGIATNALVADGAALNACAFASEGAQVRVARLPVLQNGGDQGPDDFLVLRGIDALRAVIAAAVPASPMDRVKAVTLGMADAVLTREQRQAQICAELVPLLQEPAFAATLRRCDAAEVEAVALEVQRGSGLPKRVVRQAVESFAARLKAPARSAQSHTDRRVDARPEVILIPDDHEVTQAALNALARSTEIFHRAGYLCEIVVEECAVVGRAEPRQVPIIRRLSLASLTEHLSKQVRFILPEDSKHVRTPEYVPRQIEARGQYPGFRRLDRIVGHPVLLADGRVLDRNGYDKQSATVLHLDDAFPSVPSEPVHAQAQAAAQRLLTVVQDFPFVRAEDSSAWLTALLTALARGAFEGSVPLFAVTGNAPGCGKSLLCELIGIIVTGRPMPVMSPASHRASSGADDGVDDQEMQKRIVAHILAGTPLVVIDNARAVGSPAMYAALTSHGASADRILGASSVVNESMRTTWFATGNNLLLAREMRRRSVRIRLLSKLGDPFKRADFAESHLSASVQRRRPELLVDGLTVLLAYIRAGRPDVGLAPLGSFVEWSGLARNAVVWLGLADPLATMAGSEEEGFDRETATLRSLLVGLEVITRRGPSTSKQILRSLENENEPNAPLAHAVGELVPSRTPTPTLLSHAMEPFRDRVLDGLQLRGKSGNAGWAWSVVRVGPAPAKRDERDESDDRRRSGDR